MKRRKSKRAGKSPPAKSKKPPATPRPVGAAAHPADNRLRRLEKIVQTMQLGVTITDAEGRIRYVNPADAAMHGYTVDQLIGQDVGIYAQRTNRRPLTRAELLGFSSWQRESTNVRKDGSVFPVRLLSDVVLDAAGEPIGVITTCEDISERKVAEQALRESREELERRVSDRTAALAQANADLMAQIAERRLVAEALRETEERYRDLVEHSMGLICSHDLQGALLSINPSAARLLGYTPEELLGTQMERLLVPTARPLFRQYLFTIRHHGVASGLMRVLTREGKELTWAYRNVLRRRPEGADYVVGHAVDVTEQRLLEAQLRQAQKMEALGQLTAGIAHDFNNLLSIIQANAELIASAPPSDEETLQSGVADIHAAARRGAEMIHKLLAFSRREAVALEPIDLGRLVTETSAILRRILPANIAVRVTEETGLGVARADAGAVQQILLNLATNARDAMRSGGSLTIESGFSRIEEGSESAPSWVAPGNYVVITVRDTGAGMDEQTRARVFEPFFTTKPSGQGSGLGMAMVYGLMKQHKGYVALDSALGAGTTVKLYFPAAEERPAPAVEAASASQELRGGTETILVVEDEEAVRRSARRVLEAFGYSVLLAVDGQDAIELLQARKEPVALVLADVVMPRIGGLELHAELRKGGNPVPFLLMSAYASPDVRQRIRLDAELPFVQKPWTIPALLSAVREVLDGGH
ncbi:MAG: PAS domain S-box protein [Gemmatimonadetes bacterium]|nr:PAS domain S-box protein [Gemmatimonadota bacterium]